MRVNFCIIFYLIIISGCSQKKENHNTPVSGSIVVHSDESFQPIVKAEADAFQHLYSAAGIEVKYTSQDEAITALLNGKTDMIFVGRPLNNNEQEFIHKKKITVRSNLLATDAIAFIVHHQYPDSVISTGQIRNILNGKIRTWNELNPHLTSQSIELVVDKSSSSNLHYLRDTLQLQPDAVKIYAAGSNPAVLDHIRKTPHSIGIIGVNWISDEDDPDLRTKLTGIKVLAVGEEDDKDGQKFYQPLQSNLADRSYPFTRSLYAINKNTNVGLGTGFASFILSDRGQRIILKEGLLPAIMPGREITIIKE